MNGPAARAGIVLALGASACAGPSLATCPAPRSGPIVWVIDEGWHTDIALPADQAIGPLGYFRGVFPGARTLVFGFGKRTFFTAKVQTLSELLLGPFPGPGAIQVTGINVAPDQAYTGLSIPLRLPPGGAKRLSEFLWNAVAKTELGGPMLISEGLYPGSLFYAASHAYDLSYTCNTWTADALRSAGLPVATDVMLAGSLIQNVAVMKGVCRTPAS